MAILRSLLLQSLGSDKDIKYISAGRRVKNIFLTRPAAIIYIIRTKGGVNCRIL
jgi:hypothetical protein